MTEVEKTYPLMHTSGTCIACDAHINNELVVLIEAPSGFRTRAFVLELRHLQEEPYSAIRVRADDATYRPRRPRGTSASG